jgi:RHS repeat-associated protein
VVKRYTGRHIHTDHLNTPRAVLDPNNKIRWRWLSEPFGTTAAETNPSALGVFTQPLRFPGQYADAESGLFYNWHRYFDATTGRYTQSDPIGLRGGVNTYAYVGGNPTSKADPTGLIVFVLPAVPIIITGADLLAGSAIATGAILIDKMFNSGLPPGYWPADKGAEEWGRRNGAGSKDGRRRFHRIKQDCVGSKPADEYGVDPDTGDVVDPEGDIIGNLNDAKPK